MLAAERNRAHGSLWTERQVAFWLEMLHPIGERNRMMALQVTGEPQPDIVGEVLELDDLEHLERSLRYLGR